MNKNKAMRSLDIIADGYLNEVPDISIIRAALLRGEAAEKELAEIDARAAEKVRNLKSSHWDYPRENVINIIRDILGKKEVVVILRNNKLHYDFYYPWVMKNFPEYSDAWFIGAHNYNNKCIIKENVPANDEEYALLGKAPHGDPSRPETLALIRDNKGILYIVDETAIELK